MKTNKSVKEPTLAQQKAAEMQAKDTATAESIKNTVAGQIWNEVKEKDIEMFALPGQKVYMHVHPVEVEPSKLYLTLNSSAVLPSLEVALGNKYFVELVDRFVVVARVTSP